jgi:hypothetical protein
MQDFDTPDIFFLKKRFHLGDGGPPVIMVPLEYYFSARQVFDKQKILKAFFQRHSP